MSAVDPQRCYTPEFRVSYPFFFQPQPPKKPGRKPKYGCLALFKLGDIFDGMKKAAQAALEKKFGDKLKNPDFVKKLRSPFRLQEERAKVNEQGVSVMPDGHVKGAVFITFSNEQKFGVVSTEPDTTKPQKPDGTYPPQHITDPALIYAGCYGRAIVRASAYDVDGNVGVSFYIEGFQKTRDGESLTGRIRAEDAFEPIASASTVEGGAPGIFG